MVKKFGAVFLTVLLFCCMSVPAFAVTEEFDTPATVSWYMGVRFEDGTYQSAANVSESVDLPRYNYQNAASTATLGDYSKPLSYMWADLRGFKVNANGDNYFFGNVVFYLSFYFATNDSNVNWVNVLESNGEDSYLVDVVDSRGTILTHRLKATYFEPDSSPYNSNSPGFTMRFEVDVPQETPYLSIDMYSDNSLVRAYGIADLEPVYLVIPSATLLLERSSEETEAIEEVANIIIEQNNISNQYYSNVISKVDQIYSEVNNIQTLQQEVINRMDEFNDVTSIPGSVTTKTEQAAQLITGLEGLEKPDPEQIVPDLTVDTTEISQVLGAFFQNALIMQVLLMSLGFCLVSYVLYGKK